MKLPTWGVYKWMDPADRESIHLKWCKKHNRDPNSEDHVNEFFDEMATVPEPDPNAPRLPYVGKPRGRPRKDPLAAK